MILLDTCALLWWTLDPGKLSTTAAAACASKGLQSLVCSLISGEIAIRGRVGALWVKQKTESRNGEIYSKVCGLWLSA